MLNSDARLRANPAYELVLFDRLEPEEQAHILEEADGRPSPYGLLRPVGESGLEPRVVSTDTALLFLTLAVPGPCPQYVRARAGDGLALSLGRLVLDGILEVEVDGAFRSGAAAWSPLVSGAGSGVRGGRTAALSEDALRYGQALISLAAVPVELLATRLYLYGRRPLTPTLARLATSEVILEEASPVLRRGWTETSQASPDSPWRSWQPRRPGQRRARSSVSFKLYVSPTIETLPGAVAAVAAALAEAPGVTGFKVGQTADGVARPDKMVAYFSSLEELHGGARRIRDLAVDCRPHGVPFTAAVTDDGLLSWAIDPPHRSSDRGQRSSWRTWVTMRLAEYLLDAGHGRVTAGAETGEAWQVALARLALDGVDTTSWVPDPRLFDYAAAG